MSDDHNDLAQLLRTANELQSRTNELLTSLAAQALGPVLQKELASAKNEQLYKLTGGDLPVATISTKIGVSVGSISATWQRWQRLGLLAKDGARYRKVIA